MIGYGTLFGRSTTCDQDGAYTVRFALPMQIERCQPCLNRKRTDRVLCIMGPGLNGTRKLNSAQLPAITTRHIPLDLPCLCESNATNHASIGWELVELLCNMGPG